MFSPVLMRDVDFTESPLRWIRRALGLTHGDMHRLTGLGFSAFGEIERGKRPATCDEAEQITAVVAEELARLLLAVEVAG